MIDNNETYVKLNLLKLSIKKYYSSDFIDSIDRLSQRENPDGNEKCQGDSESADGAS